MAEAGKARARAVDGEADVRAEPLERRAANVLGLSTLPGDPAATTRSVAILTESDDSALAGDSGFDLQ